MSLPAPMCFFGLLGMAGLYARQAEKTGWLGLAGYLLLSLWLTLVMGFSFVEAFILPHVASAVPGVRPLVDGHVQQPCRHVRPRQSSPRSGRSTATHAASAVACCSVSRRSVPASCPAGRGHYSRSRWRWPQSRRSFRTRPSRRSRCRSGWPWHGSGYALWSEPQAHTSSPERLPRIQRRKKWRRRRAPLATIPSCSRDGWQSRGPLMTVARPKPV